MGQKCDKKNSGKIQTNVISKLLVLESPAQHRLKENLKLSILVTYFVNFLIFLGY